MLSTDDLAIAIADPALPALPILLDNAAALGLFQRHFPQLRPTKAACRYLRYKPSVSCLAAFEVSTPTNVVRIHVRALACGGKSALPNIAHGGAAARSSGLHPVFVEKLNLALWPFPLDDELTSLQFAFQDGGLARLVTRIRPDFEFPAGAELDTVSYKPGRRFVGRIECNKVPTALLRLHSNKAYSQSRQATKVLGQINAVRTPKTLGHSDRHRSLLLEWLDGESLATALLRDIDCTRTMEAVGASLAALHAEQHAKLPLRTNAVEAGKIASLAKDSHFMGAEVATQVEQLARQCATLLTQIPADHSTVHGDFHPGQVIISSDAAVGFIDFDRAALAHPGVDVGAFMAYFERAALNGVMSTEQKDQYGAAFLRGYHRVGGRLEAHALPVFTAMALLKTVHEPFRFRFSNWRAGACALLARTAALLADGPLGAGRNSFAACAPQRISDPGALVVDQQLPQLSAALALRPAQRKLTEVVRRCYGQVELELESVRLVRHKPGRRCLIAYDFRDRVQGAVRTVLGKMDAKGRHERSFKLQQDLWASGFTADSVDGVSVPRPVGLVPQWKMWLQEHVAGQDCWRALVGPQQETVATRLSDAVDKLARAGVPTVRAHNAHDEICILEEKLSHAASELPDLRLRIHHVLQQCRELVTELPRQPELGIHRDFYPDQVVVAGDRLFILDHDLYCSGDPCLDIGNFCAHLLERGARKPAAANAWMGAADIMVRRFVALTGLRNVSAVESYITLSLARHIHLSTRFAGRRASTEQILMLCEQRLETAKAGSGEQM